MESDSANEANLYAIAKLQNGYFTARQAEAAGYKYSNFNYHVQKGHWKKVLARVYRLVNFPAADDEQYTIYSLWVGERDSKPIGVYSHLSALSMHDLSEVIPRKLYMSVPKDFRTTKVIPKNLELYKQDLNEEDVMYLSGYGLTKPKRTFLDLAQSELMDKEQFAQCIKNALDQSLITKDFLLEHEVFYPIIPFLKNKIL